MTQITAGHTVVSKGTLSAPNYLAVEPGGAVVAANGARNNYEILLHGSTTADAAGGYARVRPNATVTNAAGASLVALGGGGYGVNLNGEGGSLAIDGTLINAGLLETIQNAYAGGAPHISIAATGYLINQGQISLTGADGAKNIPFATIPGSTLTVTGVLLNGGVLSVGGGKLGLGYGGNGAKLLVAGAGTSAALTNLGTIAIHGAYPGSASPFTYPGAAGSVTVSAGGFINDAQIIIDAATNTASLYGGAGGVLLTSGSASVLNAGTITVGGQATGAGLTAPAGTLSIGGQSFYTTGAIDVRGASVTAGNGGVLDVATSLVVEGNLYVQAGSNGGLGAAAYLGGEVYIGRAAPGTLTLGQNGASSGLATVSGDLFLTHNGTIDLYLYNQLTIAKSGRLIDTNGSINGPFFGTITNNGYIGAFGTYSNIQASIDNTGTLAVVGGELAIYAAAGTGVFTIEAGGTLAIDNRVAPGVGVQFSSTPGQTETLQLEFVGNFAGTLANLNDTSALYLYHGYISNVASNGAHLTFTEDFFGLRTYNVSLNLAAPLPANTQFTITQTAHGSDLGFILPGNARPAAPPGHDPGAGQALTRAATDPAAFFAGHLTP
jgi:hypothetical protein